MKETNLSTTEQALYMYKETVSPQQDSFSKILSQIPEQNNKEKRRVVRSPYIWFAITNVVILSSVILIVSPSFDQLSHPNEPFYAIDKQVSDFENQMTEEDYQSTLADYSL